MSDEEIINKLRQGDQQVFAKIYDHFPMICSMIISNSGNEDDAKDIFQNALIVFYKKALQPEFKLTAKIGTYLYSVCHKMWLKKLTRDPLVNMTSLELAQEIISRDQGFELKSKSQIPLREFIAEKLKTLGEPCKSIIMMHEYEKRSMEEIATHFEYANAKTARQQKYKCLLRLKKLIPATAKSTYLG